MRLMTRKRTLASLDHPATLQSNNPSISRLLHSPIIASVCLFCQTPLGSLGFLLWQTNDRQPHLLAERCCLGALLARRELSGQVQAGLVFGGSLSLAFISYVPGLLDCLVAAFDGDGSFIRRLQTLGRSRDFELSP